MVHISIVEFTRRLFSGGGVSFKGLLLLPVYYLQMIPALPFTFLQFVLYKRRITKTVILKDPVFILGHYRSGTTLLQKLLVSNQYFGFMTNYDALFANTNMILGERMKHVIQNLIVILKIKNPFFHDSIVRLSDPAEEDDYLMNKASVYTAYWGLVFPKRWRDWLNGAKQLADPGFREGWEREYLHTIRYATFRNNGKQLVLKSPPNTERVSILLRLFPGAKFIYIYRNPYRLYYSVKNMWKKAILSYYSVQELSDTELDDLIFEHFIYLTKQYESQKALIPEGNLIEISYEQLMKDPYQTVQEIYTGLNLSGFEKAAEDLKSQIERERAYSNFHYELSDPVIQKIEERWGEYIRKWNYNSED